MAEASEEKVRIKFGGAPVEYAGANKDAFRETVDVVKLLGKVKAKKVKVESKQIVDINNATFYDALAVAEPHYNIANLNKLYDEDPFHASACDAKLDSVVGLGYKLEYSSLVKKRLEKVEKKENGDEKKRKLELQLDDLRDQFLERIENMNSQMELSEVIFNLYMNKLTCGNAYIEIGRTKETGEPKYLGFIPPENIRVRKARDGFVQVENGQIVFFRNYGDRETPDPFGKDPNPNEIIHIKQHSVIDHYYGVPQITSAIQAMAVLKFAMQYNVDYFENKAVPRYIIKTRNISLDGATQAKLLNFFETNVKGTSHRTVLIPIMGASQDRDIVFDPVETDRQEGHFIEMIKEMQQFIMSRHRVPQARIGLSSAATSQAESREAEKTFKETVCQPEQRFLERKMNRIFSELTDMFVFRFEEYSLTDEDMDSQIFERYARWGVLVPDEKRQQLGLGPRRDGNGSESLDMLSLAKENAKAAKISQAKANQKADAFGTRTRDQNRAANKPDKNSQNRDGRRPAGAGASPNK